MAADREAGRSRAEIRLPVPEAGRKDLAAADRAPNQAAAGADLYSLQALDKLRLLALLSLRAAAEASGLLGTRATRSAKSEVNTWLSHERFDNGIVHARTQRRELLVRARRMHAIGQQHHIKIADPVDPK